MAPKPDVINEISYREAVQEIGKHLYPDDWIDMLTGTERWILHVVRRRKKNKPNSSPQTNVKEGFVTEDGVPVSQLQITSALQRKAIKDYQRKRVDAWIDRHGLEMLDRGVYDALNRDAFRAALEGSFGQAPDSRTYQIPQKKTNAGGRPRKWDWDGAFIEVIRVARGTDTFPTKKADLVKLVALWFVEKTDDQPKESNIWEKVADPVWEALHSTSKT